MFASGALDGALAAYGGMACCRESAHKSGEGKKVRSTGDCSHGRVMSMRKRLRCVTTGVLVQ
jgi:hypothetical protein